MSLRVESDKRSAGLDEVAKRFKMMAAEVKTGGKINIDFGEAGSNKQVDNSGVSIHLDSGQAASQL